MSEKEIRPIDANATIEALAANFRQSSWDGCDHSIYQIAEDTIAEMPTLFLENATGMRPDCNTPLTLEHLREMNGKPVWVETKAGSKFWAIVTNNCVSSGDGRYLWISEEDTEYGKTWLAYAYPPDYIDREEWGRCWTCRWVVSQPSWRNDYEYCPKCGRPLTEEAWDKLEKRIRGRGVMA